MEMQNNDRENPNYLKTENQPVKICPYCFHAQYDTHNGTDESDMDCQSCGKEFHWVENSVFSTYKNQK